MNTDTVLSVADISVEIGAAKILQHVSFSLCSGDMLAVMGPTGSGKTTLLSAIAGRQQLSAGNIYLSGTKLDKRLRRRLGFVIQQDVFFSNITLWETLYFTAMISLPESLPKSEKLMKVENIIDQLELRNCANTVIGDIFHKGLSGGEKKRASIACTLLTEPDILLVDEPASGLDSSMALQTVRHLKTLANGKNKTVVVTIHQPSSEVYHSFDSLLLLAQGKVVYSGGAHREPLSYLESAGYICDPLYNPADFMMNVLRSDDSKINELVNTRVSSYFGEFVYVANIAKIGYTRKQNRYAGVFTSDSSNSLVSISMEDSGVIDSDRERWPTGFAMQFRMLIWRSFKQSRKTFLYIHNIVLFVAIGIVAGVLMSDKVKTFRDVMGLVFFVVALWAYDAAEQGSVVFPEEIEVTSKERASGAYRLSAFYLSKIVSELPLTLATPTVFYAAIFWIAQLGDMRKFFITWLIIMLDNLSVQGLGVFTSIIFSDRRLSIAVLHGVLHTSLLFCGFVIQNIPYWLAWAKYFSHMHYPISAVCIILYDDTEHVPCNYSGVINLPKCLQNSSDYVTSAEILQDAGINLPLQCYIGTIALICVALRLAVYLVLRLKRPQIN